MRPFALLLLVLAAACDFGSDTEAYVMRYCANYCRPRVVGSDCTQCPGAFDTDAGTATDGG